MPLFDSFHGAIRAILFAVLAIAVSKAVRKYFTNKRKRKFEGQLNDAGTGKGKLVAENGDIYEGEFRRGTFHGKGKYIFNLGSYYEGEFVDGKKEGYGIEVYVNGSRYEGEF